MNSKKENLEKTIEISKVKLERAEKLTSLLYDEGLRWKKAVETLEKEKETIIGDVFFSSAIISYYGPLSA